MSTHSQPDRSLIDDRQESPLILLMGTPVSSGNRGVMALAASLVELLHTAAPHAKIAFLDVHAPTPPAAFHTSSGKRIVEVWTCRLSPKAIFKNHLAWVLVLSVLHRIIPIASFRRLLERNSWVGAVARSTLVGDIRGGDSFSDIYGMPRFLCASAAAWSVLLVRRSIVHLPQTYGPFSSAAARTIARRLLLKSANIIARDKNSRRVAEDLVAGRRPIVQTPDVAFALPPRAPSRTTIEPAAFEIRRPGTIGVNINALMYHGGYGGRDLFSLKLDYRSFVDQLIQQLLDHTQANIVLIPHVFAPAGDPESDNEISAQVCLRFAATAGGRLGSLVGEYDQHELKAIIGTLDFFIGSRMHSCIAALSQGIPCVGVAYSMKFAGVFETVGVEDWVIDGRTVNGPTAIERIMSLYSKRDDVRDSMRSKADQARLRLRDAFAEVAHSVVAPSGR